MAVDKVIAAAVRHGKHLGAVASTADQLRDYVRRGVKYIAWQSDLVMYKNALKAAADNFALVFRCYYCLKTAGFVRIHHRTANRPDFPFRKFGILSFSLLPLPCD